MTEQPELDLPPPPRSAAPPADRVRRGFGGFSRGQLLLGALLVIALAWSMWVTKALVAPRPDHIVKARLSSIVGGYVAAQARSASPPAQVEAEMRAFMATLDRELQQRSARGQVVLVGEAVLTANVPDITENLAKAVYASGIRLPRPASVEEMQRLDRPALAAGVPGAVPAGALPPATLFDTMAAVPAMPAPPAGVPSAQVAPPGAAVATFGGPGGDGSR